MSRFVERYRTNLLSLIPELEVILVTIELVIQTCVGECTIEKPCEFDPEDLDNEFVGKELDARSEVANFAFFELLFYPADDSRRFVIKDNSCEVAIPSTCEIGFCASLSFGFCLIALVSSDVSPCPYNRLV